MCGVCARGGCRRRPNEESSTRLSFDPFQPNQQPTPTTSPPPPPKKHKHQTTKLNNSARGYLLHAGICALCYASDEAVEAKLERYRDIDLQFGGSREEALLEQVARALSGGDEKAFATAVAEYDALTRLDAWKTAMLLRVKKRLAARASGEEPGGGSDEDVL